jgi:hypothetical protein
LEIVQLNQYAFRPGTTKFVSGRCFLLEPKSNSTFAQRIRIFEHTYKESMAYPTLIFTLLITLAAFRTAFAQKEYPDTSRWIGQWADEGELTYTMQGMIIEDKRHRVSGYFDWTMIYSPYIQHRNLVGHTGREYFEGKLHKYTGFYHLSNTGIEQDVEVISGDEFIIQLVNDGEKMFGKNYNPDNYKGSLYALRVPKVPPIHVRDPDFIKRPTPTKDIAVVTPSPTPKPNPPTPKPKPNLPSPVPAIKLDSTPAIDPIAIGYSNRTVLTKEHLTHPADQVRIEVWDKTIVDGDVITLIWNGKVVLDHHLVTREHKVLILELKRGENLLIMHAENMGRIPPNTAAVAVFRGEKPEVYTLNSDLGKSEAIRIVRN